MTTPDCDIETGICELPPLEKEQGTETASKLRDEVIYVGDPMCSWCWGIAPALEKLQEYCDQQGLIFRVVLGGLRPGGGDPWNQQFTQFLAHHWQEVSNRSGQPFNHEILSWESFNYDTEPACRSVVVARQLRDRIELPFFAAVQAKFYVENGDPGKPEFYRDICDRFDINFDEFLPMFEGDAAKQQTMGDFQLSRNWGVTGFPSILFQQGERLWKIASGFATFENMKAIIESERATTA